MPSVDRRQQMSRERPVPEDIRRVDQLAEVVDQCVAAKRSAESLGETFLAYLLAMAIEETRAAMRVEVAEAARETTQALTSGNGS